jgi:hypothetical protein
MVAGVVLVVALAWRSDRASYRRLWLCAIAAVIWALLCFAFVGLLAFEHSDVSSYGASLECPIANEDSNNAPSHWSWVPPGEVCEYPTGDRGPGRGRIAFAVALRALPIATIVLWPRKQRVSALG